jgi:hypothetical protein
MHRSPRSPPPSSRTGEGEARLAYLRQLPNGLPDELLRETEQERA